MAAREKVVSANMLDNLLIEATGIWNDLDEGIETGLSFDQMLALAVYAKDVPSENINWRPHLGLPDVVDATRKWRIAGHSRSSSPAISCPV